MPLLSSLTSKIYRPVFREPFVAPPGLLDEGEAFFSNNVTRTQILALPNSPGIIEGIAFSADGTIAYALVGSSVIYQYNLSTAFDLTTLTYNDVSFNASSFTGTTSSATDIWVDDSGTRFYVLSDSTDNIDQFSMSTPHDLANMTHVASLNLTGLDGESSHTGMSIKSDGTKIFFIGSSNDSVYSFSMSTPWDITTLTYDSLSFSMGFTLVDGSAETSPEDIWTNGSKIIVTGTSSDSILEISLSTSWDLSTASFNSYNRQFTETSPKALWGNSNYLFMAGGNGTFYRYTIGDGSISSFILKRGQQRTAVGPRAMRFNQNGSKLFIYDTSSIGVYEYDLSTNYDISTMTYNNVSYVIDPANKTFDQCFIFGDNGTKLYITGYNNSTIAAHTLSAPYDLSSVTYLIERRLNSASSDGGAGLNIAGGVSYMWIETNPDGTKFFVSFSTGIYGIDLSTAWDLTSASYSGTNDLVLSNLGLSFTDPVSFGFGVGGTKLYIFNRTARIIYQIDLKGSYDLSGATLDSVNYDVNYLDSVTSGFTLFEASPAQAFYYSNSGTRKQIYQFDV